MATFTTIHTRIADLKKGDHVMQHGGIFTILEDAHPSMGHAPKAWVKQQGQHGMYEGFVQLAGPIDCAYARAVCIHGETEGYFYPGSDWSFQGTTAVYVDRIVE